MTSGCKPSPVRVSATICSCSAALERFVALQRVGRLAQRQPQIGPLERDVAEADGRPSGGLLRGEPGRVGLNPGEGHPRLDAPLNLHQRDLHVNRCRELRLRQFQLPELDDLAGFSARRADGAFGHAGIVQFPAASCPPPVRRHVPC